MSNANFDFSGFDNGDDAIVNKRFSNNGYRNAVSEREMIGNVSRTAPMPKVKADKPNGMTKSQIMASFGFKYVDGRWV